MGDIMIKKRREEVKPVLKVDELIVTNKKVGEKIEVIEVKVAEVIENGRQEERKEEVKIEKVMPCARKVCTGVMKLIKSDEVEAVWECTTCKGQLSIMTGK